MTYLCFSKLAQHIHICCGKLAQHIHICCGKLAQAAASSISLSFFWQPLTKYMRSFWGLTTVNVLYICVFSCIFVGNKVTTTTTTTYSYMLQQTSSTYAYMFQQISPTSIQIMACHLSSGKSLSKPVLAYCLLDSWILTICQKFIIMNFDYPKTEDYTIFICVIWGLSEPELDLTQISKYINRILYIYIY